MELVSSPFFSYRENLARRGGGAESVPPTPSQQARVNNCGTQRHWQWMNEWMNNVIDVIGIDVIDSESDAFKGKRFFSPIASKWGGQKSHLLLGYRNQNPGIHISVVRVVWLQNESIILFPQKPWTRRSHNCFWRWIHLTWWPELRWPGAKKKRYAERTLDMACKNKRWHSVFHTVCQRSDGWFRRNTPHPLPCMRRMKNKRPS